MIRAIDLDVLGHERRLPPAGLGLLAVALVAVIFLGWRFALLRAESGELADRIEAEQASGRAGPVPGALRVATGDAAAEFKRAQGVLRNLAAPWNDLFNEIEAAIGSDIGLLGLQPELAAGRVAISGEARNFESAVRFAERLNAGGVLREAFLSAHEVRVQDAQRPVRFVVSARWIAGAPQ